MDEWNHLNPVFRRDKTNPTRLKLRRVGGERLEAQINPKSPD